MIGPRATTARITLRSALPIRQALLRKRQLESKYDELKESERKAFDDKNKARQAFGLASKLDFDRIIKEDALFNFAKLTYEQLYAPFNEAIDAFKAYIKEFPSSPRIDEAYNYLTLAYLSSRNYKEAVESLEKISKKDATINTALQRAAYFRGLELFQNLNYTDAIQMFTKSLEYAGYNQQIAAQALFWRAE